MVAGGGDSNPNPQIQCLWSCLRRPPVSNAVQFITVGLSVLTDFFPRADGRIVNLRVKKPAGTCRKPYSRDAESHNA
jgi:hypothetical protein